MRSGPCRILQRIAVALLLAALASGIHAAAGSVAAAPGGESPATARFARIDSSLGLTQDSVLALAQDHRGFLWLGTQDGLNRFDGRSMVTFRADGRPGSIGGNWISRLLHDERGYLWVGTSAGLFLHDYASERFIAVADGALAGRHIYDLLPAADGALWIGSDAGLWRWHPEHGLQRPEGADGTWPDLRIRAIANAADGELWLGSASGMHRFDPSSGTLRDPPPALAALAEPINALLADAQGRLWIAADVSGARVYLPQADRLHALAGHSSERAYALQRSHHGTLWVGIDSGALGVYPDEGAPEGFGIEFHRHRPLDPTSLGRGRVASILVSADDGVWFGTWDGGASGLHPERSRFLSLTPASVGMEAMLHPSVLSLTVEAQTLWLGSMHGVYRLHHGGPSVGLLPGSERLSAFAIAADAGQFLVGGNDGLHRFDRASGRWDRPLREPALEGARIRRLLLDGDRLWLFAELRGLYVFDRLDAAPVAFHPFPAGLNHLAVLGEDRVLGSASNGLYWFSRDGRRLEHITPVSSGDAADPGELAGRPSGVFADRQGGHWVALYGAGLARFEWTPGQPPAEARFPLRAAPPELANAGVNSVMPDAHGRLWLATDRGVSRFDPGDGSLLNFGRDDGAIARGYYYSALGAVDERLFAFGSKDGLTLFDPLLEPGPRPLRAPRLTAVERDGALLSTVAGPDGLSLPVAPPHLSDWQLPAGWGRSLLFRFASPDLVAPLQLRYRYRLDGHDPDWIEVDATRRLAGYGNLPPGRYVLRLQALARDGRHSEETQLRLEVLPHWWQTWWARASALLLLALLAGAAYVLRVRQLQRARQQLERRVAERTALAEEARERAEQALQQLQATQQELVRVEKLSALGQLVAGVAHEVNTPLGVALTAASHFSGSLAALRRKFQDGQLPRSEFERFLEAAGEGTLLIQRNLERAADLVRNFKQVSVDRSSDGRRRFVLATFLDELTHSLRLLWKRRPVELEIDCDPDIAMDSFPGALGQVLTNLVQNALLHGFPESDSGPPGRMRIEARAVDARQVRIVFSDNGRGMDAETRARAFEPFFTTRRGSGGTGLGLHIVHTLVTDKLGGSIRLDGAAEGGTRFELLLPTDAP